DDAFFLLRRPRDLGAVILSMNIVMPIVALVLALKFDLHPAVKIALVAVSVSPVPPFFPKSAAKAGGQANYAVGLLVSMALLSIVVVPVAMEIFEKVSGVELHMPLGAVAKMVLATVLVPLLVGIAIRTWAPALAERVAKPLGLVATILLVASLLPVLV